MKEDGFILNVLVTSVSSKVPLLKVLKEALLKIDNSGQMVGADLNSECIGRYFCDEFWAIPRLSELSLDELLNYCNKNQISCIIPTRDGELSFFTKYKKDLDNNGIKVMVSDLNPVKTCLDKLTFYQVLKEKDFPAIETVEDINQLQSETFVVKERFGAGSKSLGLNLSREQAVSHAAKLKEPVFQPFMPGREVSADLYIDLKGKVKGVVLRTRDIIVEGESQVTSTFRNQRLEELCSSLAKNLSLYGHVVFQIIIDSKENFHIIEANCRFGGASTLSIEVGLNSFYWFLLESRGENLDSYPMARSANEKKLVRYPEDLYI